MFGLFSRTLREIKASVGKNLLSRMSLFLGICISSTKKISKILTQKVAKLIWKRNQSSTSDIIMYLSKANFKMFSNPMKISKLFKAITIEKIGVAKSEKLSDLSLVLKTHFWNRNILSNFVWHLFFKRVFSYLKLRK
jgi:hypothetical protein